VQVGAELSGGKEIRRCEGLLANYRYRSVIMGRAFTETVGLALMSL